MRILTANIRKSDADDGPYGWEHRGAWCCACIAGLKPDVLCVQEMRAEQERDLSAVLPRHRWTGATKMADCGNRINGIAYDAEQFTAIAEGSYWLSETPHLAGSRSWNSASIRLASWVRLRNADGKEFRVTNCHLDHISDEAKRRQLGMIISDTALLAADYPQALTGDFNASLDSGLLAPCWPAGWRDSLPDDHRPTFHDFRGPAGIQPGSTRIDWVLTRGAWSVQTAAIIDGERDGQYASDHAFVFAELAFD